VPLLEAVGISKRFGGIVAVKELSLTVSAGEVIGLVGPNGAGKTTLFDCLCGITRPNTGTVTFDGRRVDGLPIYQRARLGMARTFQRMELFTEMTVREHLLAATRAHDRRGGLLLDLINRGGPSRSERALVDNLLALLELGDIADLPVEALTLGQGRLVELGRALATSPKLLMLDEPSSGLDRDETVGLGRLLMSVTDLQGLAVLLVEHDLELVHQMTSRLYVLDFGQLIASGPTESVLSDPAVRRAYLGQTA
jgi:branched-chain amino acid transport system ATP-binding protein